MQHIGVLADPHPQHCWNQLTLTDGDREPARGAHLLPAGQIPRPALEILGRRIDHPPLEAVLVQHTPQRVEGEEPQDGQESGIHAALPERHPERDSNRDAQQRKTDAPPGQLADTGQHGDEDFPDPVIIRGLRIVLTFCV
ncbi:Uncharacterised protein [Mycobacteroides abscessus subsp. massiliense]|nr:Uncharacterised protein [Mycobacteroides abscessus subsp. massiliense]